MNDVYENLAVRLHKKLKLKIKKISIFCQLFHEDFFAKKEVIPAA